MKSVGLFIPLILLIASSALGQTMPEPAAGEPSPKPDSITICAGNVPPDNMVITATGTYPQCAGSCRGRLVEPLEGPVMIICAGQPIPEYYELESMTSTQACNCISDEENAFVIRRRKGAPTPIATPLALPGAPGVPFAAPSR